MQSHPSLTTGTGAPGPTSHFLRHRPDHLSPELLSDDDLALAIDSLGRKLRSSRRMLANAALTRYALYVVVALGGTALLALGPAPIVEYFRESRTLVTTWDIMAWWVLVVAATVVGGAAVAVAVRHRRQRMAGWRHRVDDLTRRLEHARAERRRRGSS